VARAAGRLAVTDVDDEHGALRIRDLDVGLITRAEQHWSLDHDHRLRIARLPSGTSTPRVDWVTENSIR
jgi:hypothetical protein